MLPHWRKCLISSSGKIVAGEMQQAVQQHRAVAGRKDKAVAVEPVGIGRIVFRKRVHSTYAIGAAPSGRPGWPLLAFCTASIDRKRRVLMHSSSREEAEWPWETMSSFELSSTFEGGFICLLLAVAKRRAGAPPGVRVRRRRVIEVYSEGNSNSRSPVDPEHFAANTSTPAFEAAVRWRRRVTGRTLGTTGIRVPRAFLGCGNFGGIGGARLLIGRGLDRRAAFATLDEALALGIDVLDTAERYADGESERAIGEWLRRRPRELTAGVRIATKVAPPIVDGVDRAAFDRAYIEKKLETSLERLGGVDRVTFYLSHAPDETTPIEETVEGFAAAIASGRVAHVGCCNVSAAALVEALEAAERLGVPGFEWVQNGFSLLSPNDDREVRAVCRERSLGYTPFSPLAGGVLTGKYRRGEPFPEGTRMALRPEGLAALMTDSVYAALDQLRDAATARGVSCGGLALAWVLAHPDCTAPVVGPSKTAPHLGHVAEALEIALTADEHARLAALFEAAGTQSGSGSR